MEEEYYARKKNLVPTSTTYYDADAAKGSIKKCHVTVEAIMDIFEDENEEDAEDIFSCKFKLT